MEQDIVLYISILLGVHLRKSVAGVAEQADARDLKSRGIHFPYRFKSGFRHQEKAVWFSQTAFSN